MSAPLLLAAALTAAPPAPPADATAGEVAAFYLADRGPLSAARETAEAGDDAAARLAAARAVKIAEAAALAAAETGLADDDPRRGEVLNRIRSELIGSHETLADRHEDAGDWAAAEAELAAALTLTGAARGPDDWRTGDARRALGDLRRRRDFTDDQRARLAGADRESALLAEDYAAGRYAEATAHAAAAARTYRELLGANDPTTAVALGNHANLLKVTGDYAAAEPLIRRALEVRRETLGRRHPRTAAGLLQLGQLLAAAGDYAAARSAIEDSLAILRDIFGPVHPDAADGLDSLAAVNFMAGDYAAARPLYERALSIRRGALGPRHPDVTYSLNNLAVLHYRTGDFAAARPLYEEAVGIARDAFGPRHPNTAGLLNNLASLLDALGDYPAAKPLYEETLAINRETFGPRHPRTALSLHNLADVTEATGDLAAAESLYREALEINREALGPRHPRTAGSLNNLARLLTAAGEYAEARPLAEEALRIDRETLGPRHPDTSADLHNLAGLLADSGDVDAARRLSAEAVAATLEQLDAAAAAQGGGGQRNFAAERRYIFEHRLSLTAGAPGAAPDALAWKGNQLARRFALSRVPDTPELTAAKTDLRRASGELAALSLDPPGDAEARTAWRARLGELAAERGRLERTLSAASSAYRLAADVTPADLAAALPPGAAVVDVHAYNHRTAVPDRADGRAEFERRLIAFVHRPGAEPVRAELGAEAVAADLVDAWRAAVAGGGSAAEVGRIGRELRGRLWEPLEPLLVGVGTVLVSPDGPLCRLPIGALPGGEPGSYLIEERTFAAVPVPRLLPLILSEEPAAGGRLLAVGGVDYDAAGTGPAADDGPAEESGTADPPGFSLASRSALRAAFGTFPALAATGREAAAVADLAAADGLAAETLLGPAATEAAVRRLAQPAPGRPGDAGRPGAAVLHLATHGYFAPPELRSRLAPRDLGEDGATGLTRTERDLAGYAPGLLSGLAFAGANRETAPKAEGSRSLGFGGTRDGLLTAEEVAALDLSDCRLAVLSACETGLGETAGGEGLLGLQRSFTAAGAGAVVASRWAVPDDPTAALMARFYRNLWEKHLPTAEALREAQLWVLNHPTEAGATRGLSFGAAATAPAAAPARSSPRAWAGWGLSGDWR